MMHAGVSAKELIVLHISRQQRCGGVPKVQWLRDQRLIQLTKIEGTSLVIDAVDPFVLPSQNTRTARTQIGMTIVAVPLTPS